MHSVSLRSLLIPLLAATAALCAAPLTAQAPSPSALVLEGDAVPGVGNVTRVDNLTVNALGAWRVEADTDHANTDADQVLLGPAGLLLREGQALPAPPGATLDSFDTLNLNANGHSGWNFFLDGTTGIFDDSGLYWDTTLVIQEGDVSSATGFTPGTPYIGFFECKFNDAEKMLVMASVDDPNIASSVDRALVRLDIGPGGALLGETVLFKEGDVLPGQSAAVEDFETGPHNFAYDALDRLLYVAELATGTSDDHAVYLGSTLLAEEGGASPVLGRSWEFLSSRPVALGGATHWAFRGNLDGDPATDEVLVVDGAVLVQEGDSVPDIAPWSLTSFGTSAPIALTPDGRLLWFGDWDDPDTSRDTGLFLDDELLVQEGVTTVNGVVLESLAGVQDGFSLSPDGRYLAFEGTLQGGINGAFLLELGGLHLADPIPGLAGQLNTLQTTGGTANAIVIFAGSLQAGTTNVPCGMGVLQVGLVNFVTLGNARANGLGTAQLAVPVGPAFSGRTVYLQAGEPGTCTLSNRVDYTFP